MIIEDLTLNKDKISLEAMFGRFVEANEVQLREMQDKLQQMESHLAKTKAQYEDSVRKGETVEKDRITMDFLECIVAWQRKLVDVLKERRNDVTAKSKQYLKKIKQGNPPTTH